MGLFLIKTKQNKKGPGLGCFNKYPCARSLASPSAVFPGIFNTLSRPLSDRKLTLTLLSYLIKDKGCSLPRSVIAWLMGFASIEEDGKAKSGLSCGRM